MSITAFLEVVENKEGEIVVRRADSSEGSSEPLVTIRFSSEVKALVNGQTGIVARAMLSAGMQMVGHLQAEMVQPNSDEEDVVHQLH
jgi:hypothetical protein